MSVPPEPARPRSSSETSAPISPSRSSSSGAAFTLISGVPLYGAFVRDVKEKNRGRVHEAGARRGEDRPHMSSGDSLRIAVEIQIGTFPVSGCCRTEGRPPQRFTGWTELFAALDAAVDEASDEDWGGEAPADGAPRPGTSQQSGGTHICPSDLPRASE